MPFDSSLGVRFVPEVRVLGMLSSGRPSNRTRLFVVIIALDAGIVVIIFSLERSTTAKQC